jgi:acyl transferase domain-containing protein
MLQRADGSTIASSNRDEYESLLSMIARLYEHGFDLDWRAFEQPFPHARVSLPSYPFARQWCWLNPPQSTADAADLPPPSAAETSPTPSPPSAAPDVASFSAHPLLRRMTARGPAQAPTRVGEPQKNAG